MGAGTYRVVNSSSSSRHENSPLGGAPAVELLTRYCVHCHDGRLDPSLRRVRFDAERLSTLPAEERRRVLDRG
jgi:hypothetical protein